MENIGKYSHDCLFSFYIHLQIVGSSYNFDELRHWGFFFIILIGKMDLDDKKIRFGKMEFKENIEEKIKEWKYVR